MFKILCLYKFFLFFQVNSDTCINCRIERCLNEDQLIIVVPAVIEHDNYQLLTQARFLKKYLIEKDSSFRNPDSLTRFLFRCYQGIDTLVIDWDKYKQFFTEPRAYIALLPVAKETCNRLFTSKYDTKKKQFFLNSISSLVSTKPYKSFKGKLREVKINVLMSKESIFKLFCYNVLVLKGDGREYLIDICD